MDPTGYHSAMRILMGTDMEGVAGVVSFDDQSYDTGRFYKQAKSLTTAEVNAAVQGLLDAGVEEVLVIDGHGPGAIEFEELHPEAKLLHGRPPAPRSLRPEIAKRYDASVMIGQHAMAGAWRGTLNHTQSSKTVEHYLLNGKPIGEIAQFALYHGASGLPLIFLSGDEAACAEAEELIPGITTAAVKEGLSRSSAITLSKEKARDLVRNRIAEAIKRYEENPIAPLVWQGPFVLEKRYLFTNVADGYDGDPRFERIDPKTVRIRSESITDIIYA